jgi:hypothetical protein
LLTAHRQLPTLTKPALLHDLFFFSLCFEELFRFPVPVPALCFPTIAMGNLLVYMWLFSLLLFGFLLPAANCLLPNSYASRCGRLSFFLPGRRPVRFGTAKVSTFFVSPNFLFFYFFEVPFAFYRSPNTPFPNPPLRAAKVKGKSIIVKYYFYLF